MLKTLMVAAALVAGASTANATTTHKKHVRMMGTHHMKGQAGYDRASTAGAGGGNSTATGGTPGGFTDRR